MKSEELESVLGTVHALLKAEDMDEAAHVVRDHPARIEQTGYDNWNGGTNLWDIFFELPANEFARMGSRRTQLEEQISARLQTTLEAESQDWYSAKLVPARDTDTDWRIASLNLHKTIRTNIFDGLRLERIRWQGQLDDVEFLNRLYNLENMPSYDQRFENAAGDIWQHCINNDDWDENWIFADKRFDLSDCPPEDFLRFLCETVHPVVRPERDVAIKLVTHYNDQLRLAGWEIAEEERIGGRPRFTYRKFTHNGGRAVTRGRSVADALDAGWMAKQIERLERAIDSDPDLAIGTAKELVESCCKTILTKRGIEFSKRSDLNDLTKLVVKELQLVPDDISDQAKGADNIRLILRNLTQLTNNLAQLRGLYGTGHGHDGQRRGLQPRHARLAVAAAVAFIDFAAETYRQREALKKPT